MNFDDIVKQNIAKRRQPQLEVTATDVAVADDTTPARLGMEEQRTQGVATRYGLFPYGNQYGFTKLNQLIDEDGLDSQQRYELQQQWFKNQENYIKSLPTEEQVEWNKVLNEIKAGDNVLKAYSTLGGKVESLGTGVARMSAGVNDIGARTLSLFDKTDGTLEKEIAAEHKDAYEKYKAAKGKLVQIRLNSYDNPAFYNDGSMPEDYLSKEEQNSIAWFDDLLAKKRTDTMYSDDANFLVKDALRARDVNVARANKKSEYAGAKERRATVRNAGENEVFIGEAVETAKATWNDPNAALDVAFESTGANLIPQLVGIAAGAITRSPMVYQVISSIGQAPSEIQAEFQETLQKKYAEKYGKADLSKITSEELETLIKENAAEFDKSFDGGVKNAAIIALTEPLAAKGVGKVAAGFTKLSSEAKSKTLKALGITGAAAAKFTGEGWEEAFGQIATNIANDKPWGEGVGQSFVMALLGVENIPNTIAVGQDVKNQLRDELGLGAAENTTTEQSSSQATTGNEPTSTAGGETAPTQAASSNPTPTQTASSNLTPTSGRRTTVGAGQSATQNEEALYAEYRNLIDQLDNGELTPDEFNQRESDILSQFTKEVVDPETGEIALASTFDRSKVYQQGVVDENRSDYRDGTTNADGSAIQSGLNGIDGSGTQSRSEVSESVSPTQTEATAAGYNQSNTQPVTDTVEQPHDNPAESSSVGTDGRSYGTNGQGVDRGELGQTGSEQGQQPTETAQLGSENGGVQQRTESDSRGETLAGSDEADISRLSDERIGGQISRLAKQLTSGGHYRYVGGKHSPHYTRDLERLRTLITEQARRKGIENPANRVIDRIRKEVKQQGNNLLTGSIERQGEKLPILEKKIDDLIASIKALSKETHGNVKNAYASIKSKIEKLIADIKDYFLERQLDLFAKKRQKEAKNAALEALRDTLTTLEEGPSKSDLLRPLSVWKKEVLRLANDVKYLMKEKLVGDQPRSIFDDLLPLLNKTKGFDGYTLHDPRDEQSAVEPKKSAPVRTTSDKGEQQKDRNLRLVQSENYSVSKWGMSEGYGDYHAQFNGLTQTLNAEEVKNLIIAGIKRSRSKPRHEKPVAIEKLKFTPEQINTFMQSEKHTNALVDLFLAGRVDIDENTLLNWLDSTGNKKAQDKLIVNLLIEDKLTTDSKGARKQLHKEIENAFSENQVDRLVEKIRPLSKQEKQKTNTLATKRKQEIAGIVLQAESVLAEPVIELKVEEGKEKVAEPKQSTPSDTAKDTIVTEPKKAQPQEENSLGDEYEDEDIYDTQIDPNADRESLKHYIAELLADSSLISRLNGRSKSIDFRDQWFNAKDQTFEVMLPDDIDLHHFEMIDDVKVRQAWDDGEHNGEYVVSIPMTRKEVGDMLNMVSRIGGNYLNFSVVEGSQYEKPQEVKNATLDESSLPDDAPLPRTSENLRYPKNMTVGEKRASQQRLEETRKQMREAAEASKAKTASHPTEFKSKDDLLHYIRELYKSDQAEAMQLVNELTREQSPLKLRGMKASKKAKGSIHSTFYKELTDHTLKTQQDLDREQAAKKQQMEGLIRRGNAIAFLDENLSLFTAEEKKALAEELKGKIYGNQLADLGLELSPSEKLFNDYFLGENASKRISMLRAGLTEQAWGKLSVGERNKIINFMNEGAFGDRQLNKDQVEFMVNNRLPNEAVLKNNRYVEAMEAKSKTTPQATKEEKRTQPLDKRIERSNDKLRKMNEATAAPKLKYADEFTGTDLRQNQKTAHRLIKANPRDVGAVREAFMKATPLARPASFEAAKRGYLHYSRENPVHKAFTGSKVNLLGFDFDGNPVYSNEQELFNDLQEQHTVDSQTALTLAAQPETAKQVQEQAVSQFFKDPENRTVEDDMREAVETYAAENDILEEDGTRLQGTDENLTVFANNQDFVSWVGDKLRPFFKKLNQLVAGVIAVVTVGAMTIPTDAVAQTGFSTYTQGETIQGVSQEASNTINWVKQHKDHNGKNFVVADKDQGKIHVVSPDGKVLSTQNALFGKGKGNDRSAMNTPSGRMQLQKETKLNATEKGIYGDSVLDFVDPTTKAKVRQSDNGIVAMHRVVNKPERKAALNSATANDNYLSHGCINIPTAFYNTAVDSLDGAMVYVLDHKAPKQATKTTTQSKGTSGLTNYKPKKLFSVSAFKGGNTLSNGLTKDGASKHLQKALGNLADNVVLVSREDYAVPNQGAERLIANGVEGFYHAESGAVVVIADSIKAQDGLTAEERLAWVAWHELHHRGFDVKFGADLAKVLDQAQGNTFINQLAMAIKDDRADNNLTTISDQKAVEEALAELGAALATDKLDALAKRYGVTVPATFTKDDTFLSKLWDSLKQIARKITGNTALSDRQVRALLDEAITSVKPDKAERKVADEVIAAYADPDSALTVAAKFSLGSRLRQVGSAIRQNKAVESAIDLLSNNDTHTAGRSPSNIQTGATKVVRKKHFGLLGSVIEGIQDSRYRIDRVDENGEGGKLSRSVANMSNRTQQKIRRMSKGVEELTRAMMDFADTHRKVFPRLVDKKQVDTVVQDITTALRTLTGGNEAIRVNLETALGGKDYYDANGNFVHHEKGLIERRQELEEMARNRATVGMPPSSYINSEISRLTREIEDLLAIQNKFDTSNNLVLHPNKNKDERKHWHGHNGFTMAEAHELLKQKAKEGLIDGDVLNGLTPNTYQVKQYTGLVDQYGNPEFVMVSHISYDANQVDANFTGEIRPLIDMYENLAKETYQWTVKELGQKLAGSGSTARWETSTMGKVKEIYTTNATDKNGNPITDTFVIENPNSIDEIVTLQKATEYTGHRTGRAFTGGSALEQLTWRIQLTAQQSSAQDVGKEMYAMFERGRVDEIRVYNIGDKDYTLQKGIVVEVPAKDNKGRVQYNADGTEKTKIVKVSFKDEETNSALFGDNIKGRSSTQELSTAALLWRIVPMTVSRLAKFAAQNLTMTPTFAVTNAYKGLKEKQNQLLAWGKNSSWVKGIPASNQHYFDGFGGNTALHAKMVTHTVASVPRMIGYEQAAIAFAWKLSGKGDLSQTNLTGSAKVAYDKLLEIYERGGISSRVEELLASSYNKKMRFALGGKANKSLDLALGVLDKLSVTTMSQELVSTLIMTDFLQNELGMDAQMAYDANLHFMNFDKRGASTLANYLRNYTMFANAIAQGSRAYLRSYTEMDREGKLHISKQGASRLARNVAIGVITNNLAMMLGEAMCPEKLGSMNQVGDLNPYQLMREIPIATGCGEFIRFPVEYGVGMTENMIGVALNQVYRGFWSSEQAFDAVKDTLKDNASPLNMPIGETDGVFGWIMMNLVYPFTPEPLRESVLAFGGVDAFGNQINSKWANSKEYRPAAGKQTTDEAWAEKAAQLYSLGFNVTPEEARVAVLGPFQGVTRLLLAWAIEKDPRVSAYDAVLGTKSIYRSAKDEANVAYTVVMNNLNGRFSDLHDYYIQAQGRDKVDPTDKWLEENGIELDADEKKILGFITKYRTQMKNTRLTQEQRYKYNMEFLKNIKTVTHPEG